MLKLCWSNAEQRYCRFELLVWVMLLAAILMTRQNNYNDDDDYNDNDDNDDDNNGDEPFRGTFCTLSFSYPAICI